MSEDMIHKIYGWCLYIARSYYSFSLQSYIDIEDLAMEGFIAALTVYHLWDPNKGKFNTFIITYIRGGILECIRNIVKNRRVGTGYKEHETLHFGIFRLMAL